MGMRRRRIPRANRDVGEIGLGCWQLGGQWAPIDEATAIAILERALAAGVDCFDTADVYGEGRSEQLLGRALRGVVPRPFVATKIGRFPDPGLPSNLAYDVMRRHVLASCRRLEVARLDLVQLHCVPPDALARGEVFDHLRRLRDEGLIANWGASVESTAEADRCLQEPDCASLQVIFNVLRQTPAASGLLARAAEHEVAVLARLPLASGLLSGRLRADTVFDRADHRSFNRDGAAFHVGETFAGLPYAEGLRACEWLAAQFPPGVPLAQWALRWILDHEAVTAVIPGASRPDQVAQNCVASSLSPLPVGLHVALREFWRSTVQPLVRGRD